jgi:hypothetical protein
MAAIVIEKFPPKLLKNVDCPGSMIDCLLDECLEDFLDNHTCGLHTAPEQLMFFIEENIDDFIEDVITNNECGATLRIIVINAQDEKNLTKQYVYDLMWSDGGIGDRYGDDFVFDMNDFGFEYIEWNTKYYLVSGISA